MMISNSFYATLGRLAGHRNRGHLSPTDMIDTDDSGLDWFDAAARPHLEAFRNILQH